MLNFSDEVLLEYGLPLIISIYVIEKCFSLVKNVLEKSGKKGKKGKGSKDEGQYFELWNSIENSIKIIESKEFYNPSDWNDISNKILALYDWHNYKDSDGSFLWYNKKTLSDKIDATHDSITSIKNSLSKLEKDTSIQAKEISELIDSQARIREKQREVYSFLRLTQKVKGFDEG